MNRCPKPEQRRKDDNAIIVIVIGIGIIVIVAIAPQTLPATKDSELLACDVECRLAGVEGLYLELDIPGLIGDAR